ncbi:MAG: hypothetical protein JWQ66_1971 [Mucilaginibacter sp.]|nr:hypothetical protein [Mucilaginibacter sp.]
MKNITAGVVVNCYKKHLWPASGFKIVSFKDYRIRICDSIKHKIMSPS